LRAVALAALLRAASLPEALVLDIAVTTGATRPPEAVATPLCAGTALCVHSGLPVLVAGENRVSLATIYDAHVVGDVTALRELSLGVLHPGGE